MKRMAAIVPAIEGARHEDLLGVRRPHGKIGPLRAVHFARVRAHVLVELDVAAFVKQVEVVIAEQRHWRAPRQLRPYCEFARRLAESAAASLAALNWLLEHFAEESPARDLRHSQAQ